MRKIALLFFLSWSSALFAQEDDFQSVFSGVNDIGVYFSFDKKISPVNNKIFVFSGGKMAAIVNKSLALGIGGQHITSDNQYEVINRYGQEEEYELHMKYGGAFMEYIAAGNRPIHVTFPVFFGFGVSRLDNWNTGNEYDQSAFFIVEPEFNIEANIIKFVRAGFGAGYRFVTASNLDYTSDEDLSNFYLSLTLRLGLF